jgi:ATP-dependent DNA helicase DinG
MIDPVEALSENGPLATYIENFAVRPQQQQLAAAIAEALENDESLICEAGTGTGKTFAYLIPALLSGKKVIISTGTKHLQDQLFYRDLPVICNAIKRPVSIALLKGRGNYLCWHRFDQTERDVHLIPDGTDADLSAIRQWATRTVSGDLGELKELSENSLIQSKVISTTENCLGQDCDYFKDCFVFKARQKANEADLIIVNHHLLFADLSLREAGFGEVLPKADTIIFDEAHQLPDLATEFFSQSLSSYQITEIINDIERAYSNDANDIPEYLSVLDNIQKTLKKLCFVLGDGNKRIAWNEVTKDKKILAVINEFKNALLSIEKNLDKIAIRSKDLENCWRRCSSLIAFINDYLERDSCDFIQWLETRGQGFILHQTPIDISETFQTRLSEHQCNCIYTSATLAIDNNFSHFKSRLGLMEINSMAWDSPFDYSRQALLYLPADMPDPRHPSFLYEVINAAVPVILASQGHTFILFTSHRALNQARELIIDRVDYPILVQGDATRTELLKRFRVTKHAVLLGTNSFWEGVDVRGQALSCVIIEKLPFTSPDDPVFKARSAKMEENGKNPFIDYQVPEAIINLRQGVGRLIRDISDYGVLVICDPRLSNKSYGKRFMNGLPELPLTDSIEDVEVFFAERELDNHIKNV